MKISLCLNYALYSIGIDDFIGKDGVTIVEWSERLTEFFSGVVEIEITDAGDDSRILIINSNPANINLLI